MKIRNVLIAIACSGFFAACSTTEEDPYGSTDSYCAAKAEAECTNVAKRCGAAIDACKQRRTSICNTAASSAINQGRSYQANAVQDCIDSINDTYRNGANDVTVEGEAETAKICERVFSGSKKESIPCTNTFECASSLICDKGVCIREEKVSGTGQCNNAGQVCETGSFCQPQGATRFCAPKKSIGEDCSADVPCNETLRCVSTRCMARVTVGNPCDNDDQCAPEAPYCDASTKKCRPKYESTSAACRDYGL